MSKNQPTNDKKIATPKILELAVKVPDPRSDKFKKHHYGKDQDKLIVHSIFCYFFKEH